MFYILKRPKLGRSSLTAFKKFCKSPITIIKNNNIPQLTTEDTILRWGCTSELPQGHILNKANAIGTVNNKFNFRYLMQENHPEITPKSWFDLNNSDLPFPVIIRPHYHAQGNNLFLVNNFTDLLQTLETNKSFRSGFFYISEYIPKVKEYRVCFIQGRVAWVAEKIPANPEDIAWNVAQGGKFINCNWKNWPIKAIEACYKAYKLSGLWLSGIDVMIDAEGNPYILEANSGPSHTSPYRQQCTAKCIDYYINVSKEEIPLNTEYKKYLRYIHPAIKGNNDDN